MKNLIIINNEKVFEENKNFYCDNLDLKILPEDLNNYYKVQYIVRSTDKKKDQKINLDNVKPSSNILKFIYFIYKTLKLPNASYLLISITPYTFFSFIFLCSYLFVFIFIRSQITKSRVIFHLMLYKNIYYLYNF